MNNTILESLKNKNTRIFYFLVQMKFVRDSTVRTGMGQSTLAKRGLPTLALGGTVIRPIGGLPPSFVLPHVSPFCRALRFFWFLSPSGPDVKECYPDIRYRKCVFSSFCREFVGTLSVRVSKVFPFLFFHFSFVCVSVYRK